MALHNLLFFVAFSKFCIFFISSRPCSPINSYKCNDIKVSISKGSKINQSVTAINKNYQKQFSPIKHVNPKVMFFFQIFRLSN